MNRNIKQAYLHLPPDVGVFVWTLDILQQLLDQKSRSLPVHRGRCELQTRLCGAPSLLLRLQVTQRTRLYAFIQRRSHVTGGGRAEAADGGSSGGTLRGRSMRQMLKTDSVRKTVGGFKKSRRLTCSGGGDGKSSPLLVLSLFSAPSQSGLSSVSSQSSTSCKAFWVKSLFLCKQTFRRIQGTGSILKFTLQN